MTGKPPNTMLQPSARTQELLPIHTTRLVLRQFSPDDLEAFQAYRSDPTLAPYQGWEPTSNEQARAFLAVQAKQSLGAEGEWLQVAVTRSDTGEVIGDLGLCVIDASRGTITLGFTLARSAQGRGYATEAVTGVLDALLVEGRARSVVAVTDVRNTASVSLLRRVGLRHESTADALFRGEPCHEHTFVLTNEQWVRQQAGGCSCRHFEQGDEAALWQVFFSAIHETASADYSPEQINAWAPEDVDLAGWANRMRSILPFVAERKGKIVGYADVQSNGYIDHFFVSPAVTRQGVGSSLMRKIHDSAISRGTESLFADVSVTARPFFEKWGFEVETAQTVSIRGVTLNNFRMRKSRLIRGE